MSVAIQTSKPACHRACPDMPCYSLSPQQKTVGLAGLQKARETVREKLLDGLRKQHKKLTAEAELEDTSELRKRRILEELGRLQRQADRIKDRWS
ncbi:hypothetical protein [Vibrio sp. C8]